MKVFAIIMVLAVVLCGAAWAQEQPAGLRLPAIISDNMVLQQGIEDPIWGWAEPGASVAVSIGAQKASAKADAKGKWALKLKPLKPGQTLEMKVESKGATLSVKNILVGEVWVCGGQSNMDFGLGGAVNSEQEIKDAKYPQIRHFRTDYAAPAEPAENCRGQWEVCSPETAGGFTAVGYFFGRRLHKELKVPVGLIKAAIGGTPVESWTGKEMMKAEPEFGEALKQLNDTLNNYPEMKKKYEAEIAAREEKMRAPIEDKGWEVAALDEGDWKEIAVPGNWEMNGLGLDGCVWLRKTVTVPDAWAGKELTLSLGPIDNSDITYWNGVKVGEGDNYKLSRTYTVPAESVKAGKAVIAVRVYDTDGYGGINGKSADEVFMTVAGQDKISLAGQWKYKVAFVIPGWPMEPLGPGNAFLPSALYNGMIAPHVPFGIKGAIWYQGEGNERDKPNSYFYKLRGMIKGWRSVWGVGDFPFYYTQIANFRGPCEDPAGDDGVHWATVRQSQLQTLSVKNTGMAVAIDLADPGAPGDIHPKDKQDVGDRLALWALAKDYGQKNLVYSGPLYKSMKVESGKIRISFDCVGGGLMIGDKEGIKPTVELKGVKLQTFAVAGEDKVWYWADAVIDGNTVLVSSPNVAQPAAVRYAYSMNPVGNKLYNKDGLPASPFRTDNW